jgi:hypothetical protein
MSPAAASAQPNVVYAALIALEQGALLVPNAALVDVLAPAALVEAVPALQARGCAGWIDEDGQRLPVLSFETLLGGEVPARSVRSRLVLLQGLLSASARVAVLAQSPPRRISLMRSVLLPDEGDRSPSEYVTHYCRVAQQPAYLPDLAALERFSETLMNAPPTTVDPVPPDPAPPPEEAPDLDLTITPVGLKRFDQDF